MHSSKIFAILDDHFADILRRIRSAESWIGVRGFLISSAMRRATSQPRRNYALGYHQFGDVVERHDMTMLAHVGLLAGDTYGDIALASLAIEGDLCLHAGRERTVMASCR